MDFINNIESETLIICNNNIKDIIIDMHLFKPIKFMNKETFLHKYFFEYDENTILYIINKYNVRYDIAKEYLDNLYYVTDMQYNIPKLDFLVNLKHELTDNNLLIFNTYFKDYLKRIKIILYDIEIDNYLMDILSNYDYLVINPEYHNYNHLVYEFDDMNSEIKYIASCICKLIDEGISPKQIKLTNIDKSYYNTLERIFSLYNLKVNIPYKTTLASYPIVKKFIEIYKENNDITGIINKLKDDSKIYQELIKVINKYLKYNNKALLIYKLENSYITSDKCDNGIDIIDYRSNIIDDNEYIFMPGFNEGLIPQIIMDNNYLTDNICEYIGLNNTRERNKRNRNKTLNIIHDIKNLVITYKLKDDKKSYYPATFVKEFEVKRITDDYDYSYSEIYDKINLVKLYDDYFKYGHKSNNFDILNNNYQIKYNCYDNKYHLINRVMDKLTLSYSTMQTYNKCAFRYYLSNILKLDIYEENFSTTIGSMVHYVMEKCLHNNDFDTNKYANEFLKGKTFTKKELFFLDKYKKSLKELLEQVLLEREYSLFNQAMYEKKIDIDYGNNIHFVGIIDKILYYIDNNTTYISLIDYKTGNDDISLKYLKYGLNIQLPIYLYLSTKLGFNSVKYPGFYLQKFNIINKDYRLTGYSNSNIDTLSIIDNNYSNSKIIKGLKTNKDGSFSKTSKVLDDNQIEEIKQETQKCIRNVITKIKNNDFTINPKVCENVNIGCEYCRFKDICFKKIDDEVKIFESDFLGGNN